MSILRAQISVIRLAVLAAAFLSVIALLGATTLVTSADQRMRQSDFGPFETVVKDKFKKGFGNELQGRLPDTANNGNTWQMKSGEWEVRRGFARETSTVPRLVSNDYWAVLDAGVSDLFATAKIKNQKATQDNPEPTDELFGVTARFNCDDLCNPQLPSGFYVWYDSNGFGHSPGEICPRGQTSCGAIILASKDQTTSPGQFLEIRRYQFNWKAGKSHTLGLGLIGNDLIPVVDKEILDVIDATDRYPQLAESDALKHFTDAGLFARGTAGEKPGKDVRFLEFQIKTLKNVADH